MLLAIFITLVIALTGCGEGSKSDSIYVEQVTMPDGRVVDCVIFQSIQEGGITCDWDNASEGVR